jgi:RNA polymerase sigma-70 factor (sigma-E family)
MQAAADVSFEEWVAVRGAALLRFADALCGDPHRAEDLVQSALAKVLGRWSRVVSMAHPEAYVKAVIVNDYLGWWRRRSRTELTMSTPPEGRDGRCRDLAGDQASRDAAWQLLARLPRQQRAVLVLRYYEDLPDEQIAEILGCAASTVRSNATRALAALRAVVPQLSQEALP